MGGGAQKKRIVILVARPAGPPKAPRQPPSTTTVSRPSTAVPRKNHKPQACRIRPLTVDRNHERSGRFFTKGAWPPSHLSLTGWSVKDCEGQELLERLTLKD